MGWHTPIFSALGNQRHIPASLRPGSTQKASRDTLDAAFYFHKTVIVGVSQVLYMNLAILYSLGSPQF